MAPENSIQKRKERAVWRLQEPTILQGLSRSSRGPLRFGTNVKFRPSWMAFAAWGMAVLIVSCTPRARDNEFDPNGIYSNSAGTTLRWAASNLVFSPPADPWEKTVSLSWPPASNANSYRIYLTNFPIKPTVATLDALIATNTNLTLVSSLTNYLWIEAVSTNTNLASILLHTNYRVPTGFSMDASLGFPAAPSLRCVNVPQGQARQITVSNYYPSLANPITVYSNFIRLTNWNISTSLNYEVNLATNSLPGTNLKFIGTGLLEGQWNWQWNSINTIPMGTPGWFTFRFTVSNSGDADGFNAFWVDLPGFYVPGNQLTMDFAGFDDTKLTGDKEK